MQFVTQFRRKDMQSQCSYRAIAVTSFANASLLGAVSGRITIDLATTGAAEYDDRRNACAVAEVPAVD